MGETTGISWTESTWTPIRARNRTTGKIGWHCVHASEGCRFCYSESINGRLGTGLQFKPGHEKDIEIFLDEKMLLAPLRWKRPRMIFVCSMTDLFADFVKDEWIDRMFAVMALADWHTYQILTKRSGRMHNYLDSMMRLGRNIGGSATGIVLEHESTMSGQVKTTFPIKAARRRDEVIERIRQPLPNVWLGVSAEDQSNADARVPDLLATPAAMRFVSYEPALGPLYLTSLPFTGGDPRHRQNALTGKPTMYASGVGGQPDFEVLVDVNLPHLDQIICGAESGPHARPMRLEWARDVRDQCAAAGVAFFMKQLQDARGAIIKDIARFPTDLQVQQFPAARAA